MLDPLPMGNLIHLGDFPYLDYTEDLQIFIFSLNVFAEPQLQGSNCLDTFIWMSQEHFKFNISNTKHTKFLSYDEFLLD